ncbi:MAG: carbon storage regulator [Planctomycetales bacterium]|nr:carbon storage regulator [Planctomycetales bacterium]
MLVLSRKAGEKIMIGNDIEVQIQRVAGGRVTLAIEAPRDVRILRGELTPFEQQAPQAVASTPRPAFVRTFDPLRDTPMVS